MEGTRLRYGEAAVAVHLVPALVGAKEVGQDTV